MLGSIIPDNLSASMKIPNQFGDRKKKGGDKT